MAKTDRLEIVGLEEVTEVLSKLAPNHARNLGRSVIHGIASEIAKETRKRAPKDQGDLRKSIKAKRRRSKPFQPTSDVIVTKGKKAKNDGFYWHFIEFGTPKKAERPFFRPALDLIRSKMNEIVERQFEKKLNAAIKRELKKRGKV